MNISAREACRRDLYTSRDELMAKYPRDTALKVLRVRDMHQMLINDPVRSHRELVQEISRRYDVTEQCAYSDLKIVREILPTLTESNHAFDRFLAMEMYLETYRRARDKGDLAVMERCASNMSRFTGGDAEDNRSDLYALIPVQPFIPTSDPRVLGFEPIPNLRDKVRTLIEKYTRETIDIEDVGYEEADLEESRLFPELPTKPATDDSSNSTE